MGWGQFGANLGPMRDGANLGFGPIWMGPMWSRPICPGPIWQDTLEKRQLTISETIQDWGTLLDKYGDLPRGPGALDSITKILGLLDQDGMDANLLHDDKDRENLYQLTEQDREMEFLARAEFREETKIHAHRFNRLFGLTPKGLIQLALR